MTRPLPPLSKADKEHLANGSKWDLIQAVVIGVDQKIHALEIKWGVGRLLALVSDDTRGRFRKGNLLWQEAITGSDLEGVRELGPKIITAWDFMDREAASLGASELSPVVWEARTPCGTVIAVVRTAAEAHAVAREGRDVRIYTMEELARILPQFFLVNQIKDAFPAAKVDRVIQKGEGFADAWASDSWTTELYEFEGAA
jgi:hypothetical protein